LLELVEAGTIQNLDELKSAYHRAVIRTHPDTVGSNERLDLFLQLSRHYQEARDALATAARNAEQRQRADKLGHRLAFFQQWERIESMELPYMWRKPVNETALRRARQAAVLELSKWRKEWAGLYEQADREYRAIKESKPGGPYLKDALGLNVRPLVHNIIAFHLTGQTLYRRQARQNVVGIMHELEQRGYKSLRALLSSFLGDMWNGAAILD
jgi:hypothetical protein